MGIIKTVHLIYEYIRHDEEEKVAEVKRAIDGVDLEIEEGSFTAILGHNGSGKSTLAKHINGLLLPTEGTVWVGEIDTKEEDRIWDVRKTAGMVFQNPDNQIIGNIVEEDVGFGPENIGVPTDEIWKRVDESLKAVGMTAYRNSLSKVLDGSEESLNQLSVLIGEREEGELPLDKTQEIESLLLTKKDMINKQLGDLNLQKNFGCTVTRVRRSGIDLSPSPDLALKFGDKLMVVGEKEGIKGVARLLGNNAKKLSDTDFFPIAMGIVLGVLFGKLNISFSDTLSFSPGLTGGVLMVALVLSAVGKTGPIIWSMSGPANQLLRQLGLLLFLAEVGTSAGKNLVATFQESGLLMFGVGAAITVVPMLVAVIVGRLVFKINILDLLGTITGGMTSTPGLAAADSMVDSNIPSVAYATVYPIAMVFLILFIQVISSAVY